MTTSDFERHPVAESRYAKLSAKRQYYIDSAKECCRYTVPALSSYFEPQNIMPARIATPYQSIGARGVNNLASKLLLALTPVNVPMFRLTVDDPEKLKVTSGLDSGRGSEIEAALMRYAESVLTAIKASGDYAHMYEVWQLLLVSGNVLIIDPPDNGNIRIYPLRDYVLKRDRSGRVIEIVLKESIKSTAAAPLLTDGSKLANGHDDMCDIYTYAELRGGFYYTHQECGGEIIKGTEGKYPPDGCPFIAVRMYAGAGEDYSRSYVSNFLGDLKSSDALSQAAVEGGAMAAKHIYMVRPDGLTDIKDIEDTANGGVIYGRADDVQVMQSNKSYDLRVVSDEAAKIEKRLAAAFMLFEGGMRDSDRVSAAEINALARELECTLGGVYSVMCHAFQIPYIKRKIWKLQELGRIRPLDKGITPVIVTGFEALGMHGDKDKLADFIKTVSQVLGKDAVRFIEPYSFIRRTASSIGVDVSDMLKSAEELAAEERAAQMAALDAKLAEKALPAAINNADGIAKVIESLTTKGE